MEAGGCTRGGSCKIRVARTTNSGTALEHCNHRSTVKEDEAELRRPYTNAYFPRSIQIRYEEAKTMPRNFRMPALLNGKHEVRHRLRSHVIPYPAHDEGLSWLPDSNAMLRVPLFYPVHIQLPLRWSTIQRARGAHNRHR